MSAEQSMHEGAADRIAWQVLSLGRGDCNTEFRGAGFAAIAQVSSYTNGGKVWACIVNPDAPSSGDHITRLCLHTSRRARARTHTRATHTHTRDTRTGAHTKEVRGQGRTTRLPSGWGIYRGLSTKARSKAGAHDVRDRPTSVLSRGPTRGEAGRGGEGRGAAERKAGRAEQRRWLKGAGLVCRGHEHIILCG